MNTAIQSKRTVRQRAQLQTARPIKGDQSTFGSMGMFTIEAARAVATEWIAAWNAHDLNRIMSHYGSQIEFSSPFVPSLVGERPGTIRGLPALREYLARALAEHPELVFRLCHVYIGLDSLVVEYLSVDNLHASESMVFDSTGRVRGALPTTAPPEVPSFVRDRAWRKLPK